MSHTTVYLVQLPDSARDVCLRAARGVFPQANFVTVRTLLEAVQHEASGAQLLVLGRPDEADIGLAAQTLDAGELPRWAVIALGGLESDLVETVPQDEWNVALLARVFRSAVLQHELLRENLQLRGDLKTIARRVTHDARTPLGCIQTVTELLKDSDNPDTIRESVDVVRNSTSELNHLIDRVSFVIRASIDPLPPTLVPLGLTIDAVLQQLRPEIETSGKKIKQPASWPEVHGVPGWIEAVWWNLIRNALHHGARTGQIQLGWNREGDTVRCWVSSQGTVPAASRPRLLRRFHILHQHTSAGLGLSMVERLVSLQGGRCTYEGTDDNRSVFSFFLPAAAIKSKETPGAVTASIAV